MLIDDRNHWDAGRGRQDMGLAGLRGTPEQQKAHRTREQADYERQLARYVARGGYGYF